MTKILCFDPSASDKQSQVRGVGRYLQILKENFPEWIFSNTLHVTRYTLHTFINPFFNFLQKPVIFKRIAKKQIAVIHDLIPLKYPQNFPKGLRGNFNIFLNKIALKNYDLIVTDSKTSKKDIVQILKIPEEKIKVIYPCLPKIFDKKLKTQKSFSVSEDKTETQNLKTEKNNENKKFLDLSCSFEICDLSFESDNFCLYVGDATWNKNLVNLARAIKIANVTCVFVGKIFENFKTFHVSRSTFNFNHPWQKELKEFFKLVKDDKRFIFLGYVSDEDLIKLYQKASGNILISRDEGFGFSYLEASSQGCPSILSDIEVFQEIAKDNALYANPNDPNDLADKIIELYFDKNRQKTLGEKALKRAQFFSYYKFKKSFLEVIDKR